MRWLVATAGALSLGVIAWSFAPLLRAAQGGGAGAGGPQGRSGLRTSTASTRSWSSARRAWASPLREHVAIAVAEESARAGFDPLLILAVIAVESEFQESGGLAGRRQGADADSPHDAVLRGGEGGLRLSREEMDADPALAVRLGVRYLGSMADRFGGDLNLALMAYNAGPNKLAEHLKRRDLEPFRELRARGAAQLRRAAAAARPAGRLGLRLAEVKWR